MREGVRAGGAVVLEVRPVPSIGGGHGAPRSIVAGPARVAGRRDEVVDGRGMASEREFALSGQGSPLHAPSIVRPGVDRSSVEFESGLPLRGDVGDVGGVTGGFVSTAGHADDDVTSEGCGFGAEGGVDLCFVPCVAGYEAAGHGEDLVFVGRRRVRDPSSRRTEGFGCERMTPQEESIDRSGLLEQRVIGQQGREIVQQRDVVVARAVALCGGQEGGSTTGAGQRAQVERACLGPEVEGRRRSGTSVQIEQTAEGVDGLDATAGHVRAPGPLVQGDGLDLGIRRTRGDAQRGQRGVVVAVLEGDLSES